MKNCTAVFAFALTLAAATTAAAQVTAAGQRDINYQNSLLSPSRVLSPADEAFCARLNASKPPQHDYCKVMRLFIADAKAGQARGVPPWAQDYGMTYASDGIDAMMAAMKQFPPQ